MAKKTNKPAEAQALPTGYVPDLKKVYKEEIVPALMKQFSYTTVMQVPRLVKITLNEGVGDATQDKKLVEEAAEELSIIAGQKAVITNSRKDISNVQLIDPQSSKPTRVGYKFEDGKKIRFAKKSGEEIK